MEIINSLMTFFGINALSAQPTFPEFLQWLVTLLLAVVLVVQVLKALFKATYKIERGLR